MDASGVFGRSMGTRRAAMVLKAMPNILSSILSTKELQAKIMRIPGFQLITAKQFALGIPKFRVWLKRHPMITYIKPKAVKPTSSKLSGQTVVFTGFRDSTLEGLIAKHGGTLGTSVNSKTTVLLVKDPNSGSGKLQAARAAGVKIMTAQQFISKFNLK